MTSTDLKAARAAATERFLTVAEKLKEEAGVTQHEIRRSLSGRAFADGLIIAPEGRTRKQLYILAHECAHVALGHCKSRKPKHVCEHEAETWAHSALRRHNIPVPRAMTERAKEYVAWKIVQAERRGAKEISTKARRYSKS